MMIKLLWVCLGVMSYARAGNILVIVPLNSPSHFIMFDKMLRTLAERGHNLDVVSHFPHKTPIPGYNDLSISHTAPQLKNNLSVSLVENHSQRQLQDFMLTECGYRPCHLAFQTRTLQNLLRTEKRYDLLITELFGTDCALGFAHVLNIPAVASMTTSVTLPWSNHRIGNPDNPAYVPTYFTIATPRMGLLDRIRNTYNLISWNYAYVVTPEYSEIMAHFLIYMNLASSISVWIGGSVIIMKIMPVVTYNSYSTIPTRQLCNEFFGPEVPDVDELVKRTNLLLVNSHFSINQARPTVPNFIEVGGLHIEDPKPVPKNLETIIKKNKHGFIYLTMGSMVMTESFSIDKLQGMFDAFQELPQTVLWKANKTRFPEGLKFPTNIHFEPWMPQLDLLCHPDIKLFVSHGGLLGSQEAIYCGVPRIGIPLFADQELNIFQSVSMGIAVKVDYNNITRDSLMEATKEILEHKKYSENAKKISELFKDRQNHPLDTAIYWVEYVMRHKGAPHLRSVGADLPWYQYYLIDVAASVISMIILITYGLYIACKHILNIMFATGKVKVKSQ